MRVPVDVHAVMETKIDRPLQVFLQGLLPKGSLANHRPEPPGRVYKAILRRACADPAASSTPTRGSAPVFVERAFPHAQDAGL